MTAPRFHLRDGRWAMPGNHSAETPEAIARESDRAARARITRPANDPTSGTRLDRLIFGLSDMIGSALAKLTEREFVLLLVLISLLLGVAGKAL